MKKIGFVLLSALFLTTGCFLSDDAKLASASKKLGEADNYTMNMKMNLEGTSDGEDANATIDMTALVDQKNDLMKMEGEFSMMGMSFNITSYTVENSDNTTTNYTKNFFTNAWEKETTEEESDYEDAITSYNFVDDATEVVSLGNVEGVDMYEITVNPEDLGNFLDGFNTTASAEEAIEEPLIIKVGLKNGYIYNMEFDITEYMDSEDDEVTKAILIITFTDINETEVTIPQSVIDSAVEAE